jgi:prevent-host-death family protein
MQRLETSAARKHFAEVVNRAFYAKEVTIITRRGKELAAIGPLSALQSDLLTTESGKKRRRAGHRTQETAQRR